MLELRNIYKTYYTKGAPSTAALIDVSLKFEQRGMVFILGKSGSGKSTFLNVVGGLDKYDSGEIIIKGKSSVEFTGSDFDSYRNTYLGFIFQEYNIIEEFSIGHNLSLALELQHRQSTPEDVANILKKVDMDGYADRMPNQISGGQRQRVAIARALIKDPEIIMADEPTGALDSATGEQIFEVLKGLSQEKLVIVVSHDREYAELYGDRIIEFKDGRIISDMIKSGGGGFDETIKTVDGALVTDKLIKIPAGTALTGQHSKLIQEMMKGEGGDIIISTDQNLNRYFEDSFKQTSRRKGGFVATTEDKLDLTEDTAPFKLIKSRLPAKSAIRMARSSMKHKRGRLVFSIILAVLAVTFFGFSSVVGNFSARTAVGSVMRDNGYNYISITKNIISSKGLAPTSANASFDDNEREKISGLADGVGELTDAYVDLPLAKNSVLSGYNSSYFTGNVMGYVTSESLDKMGFDIPEVYGRYPKADNEILISNYTAQHFMAYGLEYFDNGETKTLQPAQINSVLNYTLKIGNKYDGSTVKIVGIINFKIERYADYLKTDTMGSCSNALVSEFTEHRDYELSYIYGLPGLKAVLGSQDYGDYYWSNGSIHYNLPGVTKSDVKGTWGTQGRTYSSFGGASVYLGANGSTVAPQKLEKGEIILNLSGYNYNKDNFASTNKGNGHGIVVGSKSYDLSASELESLANSLGVFDNGFKLSASFYDASFMAWDNIYYEYDSREYTVVGVVSGGDYGVIGIFSDEDFAEIKAKGNREAIFVYVGNNAAINTMIKNFVGKFDMKGRSDLKTEYGYILPMGETIEMVSMIFSIMSIVFFYMSLAFCLFAALLLLNFISTSVAYKRKEIGILRAIGARKSDVNSIFLWEGLFISMWIIGFAVALVFTIVVVFNNLFGTLLGITFTLLTFGILDVLLMAVVCLVTVAIASILPVTRVSSLKPIDAIRGNK